MPAHLVAWSIVLGLLISACAAASGTASGGGSERPTGSLSPISAPTQAVAPGFATATAVASSLCKVVPIGFCDRARVTTLDSNGAASTYVVLDLPAGVPITAPVSGRLDKARGSGNVAGFVGIIRGSPAFVFSGDLAFGNLQSADVAAGAQIAAVAGSGTWVGIDGPYNLAITVTVRGTSGPVVDEASLRAWFPSAFAKPSVSIRQLPPGAPIVFIEAGASPPGASSAP